MRAVATSSVNTNHAERDSHIRADGLLKTEKYPEATFVSESFNLNENGKGTISITLKDYGMNKYLGKSSTQLWS